MLPFKADDVTLLLTYLPPVIVATVCGLLVGLERKFRKRVAGIKTNIMICVGSTLFTTTAFFIAEHVKGSDPARMISYIISGIGFLGTGVIFKEHDKVTGLTTASLIWVLSAVGVIIGAGGLLTGFLLTLGLVVVTLLLTKAEQEFFPRD